MGKYAQFQVETVYDTRPGGTPKGVETLNLSLQPQNRRTDVRSSADDRVVSKRTKGPKFSRGDWNTLMRLDNDKIGWLLKLLFGKAPSTAVLEAATSWTHDFTHQDDQTATWPSLSLDEAIMKLTEKRHTGVLIDSLGLSFADGGDIALTWGLLSNPFVAASFGTAQSVGSQDFRTQGDVTTFTLGGTSYNLRSFSMNINNNLEEAFEAGSRKLVEGVFGDLTVEGELSIRYTTQTILDDFLAETERALQLIITGPALGANNYLLTIDIGLVSFDRDGINIDEQAQQIQNVPWKMVKPSSGADIQFSLVDGVTSYA